MPTATVAQPTGDLGRELGAWFERDDIVVEADEEHHAARREGEQRPDTEGSTEATWPTSTPTQTATPPGVVQPAVDASGRCAASPPGPARRRRAVPAASARPR